MPLSLSQQKYIINATLVGINVLLCATFGIYTQYWYAFLFALGLSTYLNCFSVLLLLGNNILATRMPDYIEPARILYLVPCYNESYSELLGTINALTEQYHAVTTRAIVVVCDGRVQGHTSDTSTDRILKSIFKIAHSDYGIHEKYLNASGSYVHLEIHKGVYKGVSFMLMIKNANQGKRDSITLIRRLALGTSRAVPASLMNEFIMKTPDFIIGVDADTILHPMCSYELMKTMSKEGPHCKGCVGLVDIPPKWNLYVMYQYAEYHFGQFIRRRVQSEITGKVNCLSGCNQIIRVCYETCGDELLDRFNRVPDASENIFTQIRAYASEDRNHVCLMLSMYPWVRTVQNTQAIAYTNVPESVPVFLSQRRRWTLGALSNDMLLTYLPGINLFERISAIVNILTFMFNTFIVIATGFFIHAIVTSRNMLMLYLSIPMIIPFMYAILQVPISRGFYVRETVYYYISYLVYLTLGLPVSMIVHYNSLLGMDTFKWGKTRKITELNTAELNAKFAPIVFYIDDDPAAIELTGDDYVRPDPRETFV